MANIPQSAKTVLESDAIAHLVTINPDGSPQVSCVWVGLDQGEILVASIGPRQKLRNVGRDPRVALSIEQRGANPIGLKHHLIIHGRARVQVGGAPAVLQKLAEVYIGPGTRFPPMDNPPDGFVMRITPERIGGIGPWAEE